MFYHLKASSVKRSKNESLIARAAYITGRSLYDSQKEKYYRISRQDIRGYNVCLPPQAPAAFADLQTLCEAMEQAEKRKDARTAWQYIITLPTVLSPLAQQQVLAEFVQENFTSKGHCVIVGVHEKSHPGDSKKRNPHVHILVSTRIVTPDGFSRLKDRTFNYKQHIRLLRQSWADVQNRKFVQLRMPHRVYPNRKYEREYEMEKSRSR